LAAIPGNRLEALKGSRKGRSSIRINDRRRLWFVWKDGDAYDVEIMDTVHGRYKIVGFRKILRRPTWDVKAPANADRARGFRSQIAFILILATNRCRILPQVFFLAGLYFVFLYFLSAH
jgi:hypothetical protein